MLCKVVKNKKIKEFFLKRKLRKLEYKRKSEIIQFINNNPSQASKMDNIEKQLHTSTLIEVAFKIQAAKRLLEQFSKN